MSHHDNSGKLGRFLLQDEHVMTNGKFFYPFGPGLQIFQKCKESRQLFGNSLLESCVLCALRCQGKTPGRWLDPASGWV